MNITFTITGIVSLIIAFFLIRNYKFYNHKVDDMLFATKLKVFLGAIILVIYGLFIIINEIMKL